MKEEITYQQAKEAKQTLIRYLEGRNLEWTGYDDTSKNREILVYLALKFDYFLE